MVRTIHGRTHQVHSAGIHTDVFLVCAKYGFTTEQMFEGYKILKAKGVENFGIHSFLASNTVTNDYYPTLARELGAIM